MLAFLNQPAREDGSLYDRLIGRSVPGDGTALHTARAQRAIDLFDEAFEER
jgi:hypothetical protein